MNLKNAQEYLKKHKGARVQSIREYLSKHKERFFTANEIAEALGENPAKMKMSLEYLSRRDEIGNNKDDGTFAYKDVNRKHNKATLASRIKGFVEKHPAEIFTADEVATGLKENRGRIVQCLSDSARFGDIGKYGERGNSLFGTKEAIKTMESVIDSQN